MTRAIEPLVVVGATGMLGRAFQALLARDGLAFRAVDVPEIDLTDPDSVARCVADGVQTVVNCAAFTDVDGAETREEIARAINGEGVALLARRCRELDATLVHYSTDYVFEGHAERPYAVDHPRAPLNAYGRSKAVGEQALEQSGCRYLLIRTSWLYAPWGKNFVLTIRELARTRDSLKVVSDQVGRPTSAEYLAERSLALLRAGGEGAFHVTDGGECSWFEFARSITQLTGARCRVDPCTAAEFARPAPRPQYSVLDLSRTEALIGPSRSWQENLADVLRAVEQQQPRP
jgi:dTDP-4-dehydrorhamnose reductase